MTITVGSTPIQSIYIGSTPVQAVYVGSTLVWSAGTPYYKWQNSYGVTAYTTSSTPSVGDRIAQKIGNNLCYTAEIIAVSGTSFNTYGLGPTSSTTVRQWNYSTTELLPQSQPIYAYKWLHSSVAQSFAITPERNPTVGEPIYSVDYRDWWSTSQEVLQVTTDGSGNVAYFAPSQAVAGITYIYSGVYQPTSSVSYSGLNATGDASSYAFPVSSGTITDGTHTATLSQNSSVTLSWPGTHTTTYVVLGTNGQLSAHTSLSTAPAGFVIYYVHVEPETYGLSPYWDVTQDNRIYAEYVNGT